MHRNTLLASTLAVLMAGATSFAMAQDAPPPPPSAGSAPAIHAAPKAHGDHHGFDMHQRSFGDELALGHGEGRKLAGGAQDHDAVGAVDAVCEHHVKFRWRFRSPHLSMP